MLCGRESVMNNTRTCVCLVCLLAKVMKVWSMPDGRLQMENTALHGDSPITSLILDTSGRR